MVADSHVHWKHDNISEMMLDKDVVTTATNRKWYLCMLYLIAAIVMTLSVLEVRSPIASLFKCNIFALLSGFIFIATCVFDMCKW